MRARSLILPVVLGLGLVVVLLGSLRFGPTYLAHASEFVARLGVSPGKPQMAAGEAAELRVQAPGDPVSVGEVFTVTVAVGQLANPLGGFQFDLLFDPGLLDLRDASPGQFLGQTGRQVVCPGAAESGGNVRFACASTGEGAGSTGEGVLATLTFEAIQGGVSDLVLENVQLPDTARPPNLIAATTQDSEVTILPGPTPVPPTWTIYLPLITR